MSIMTQGLQNTFMIFGWISEIALTFALAYIKPINKIFGTRDIQFTHFIMPSVPFAILFLVYDELRKFLIRVMPKDKLTNKPSWMERNSLW